MTRRLIITCMKNEAPFILEWVAYHRSIGFNDFLVFTNDCDDGTVEMLDCLAGHGILTRMDNPYLDIPGDHNPQKGALRFAEDLPKVAEADWVMVSDVDEFVNIHTGDGTLDALFAATGEIDVISMQWRLFGNGDLDAYEDKFVTEQFIHCAPKFAPNPVQAWAVKSMYSNAGDHKVGKLTRIGVHRPMNPGKGEGPDTIRWVDGSGRPVLDKFVKEGWRFGTHSYGYDLVTLNHYACRSAESFVVKRDRGRVNHVDRDQGLAYWLRMNFNMEQDRSILAHVPRAYEEFDRLAQLDGVLKCHSDAVRAHKNKIKSLLKRPDTKDFYQDITSDRMQLVSRHLNLLNRKILTEGPGRIPKEIFERIAQVPDLMAG
ncbi:Glycosyl transferase, group 2 family protein [Candidatus Rhodobacter oscarellae]|uniref:Glycosyl transferase, group 2 family protein n=1 Tax=Candidatus Rhodobacter oscarellae TaxID=1675527 RepID=A0A0J9E6V5_9RHOB|nr:glycosyltransferase family 2 protein [Candidatus Rhodobacter lobularis]KMW57544.1 Glycosyl transferase, group 2 family protein [Candidatus Rhodobacter lobularis]